MNGARQAQSGSARNFFLRSGIDDAAQDRGIVPRAISETFVDHDGGEIGVQHRSADGVLGATDDDRLVDELVLGAAQPAPLRCDRRPSFDRRPRDDEDLEIRQRRFGPPS